MKDWTLKKIVKEIITTLFMIFIISIVLNYIRQPETSDSLLDIKALDIDNNQIEFMKLDKENRPTIIHFWATWCPTCKLEAPNIEALRSSCNVVTIAVNSGSNELIKSFMKERNLGYRVINDKHGDLAKKFGVGVYPTTFIYDSKGLLKFSEVGYSTTMGLKARVAIVED